VWGWGPNYSGQLGDGTFIQRLTPVKVHIPESLSGVIVAIAGGGFHSLALEQNGRVWAWGGNGYGQLGNGDTTDRWLPVRPVNMYEVTAIAVGFGHSLVLKRDGSMCAWGMNSYGGQLGDNTTIDRYTQVPVMGLPGVSAIAAGCFHSLAT
jgi:alpha-tubulin suppressor-like RCC1 family protein